MNERPIPFTGEMVRAILAGRKSQTRRVIKPQLTIPKSNVWGHLAGQWWTYYWHRNGMWEDAGKILKCPYGNTGDRLWVRETWGAVSKGEDPAPIEECNIEYRADLPVGCTDYPGQWPKEDARGCEDAPKWKSSRFMFKWMSRIKLEIVNIRVERVREISEEDAVAEGIDPKEPNNVTSACYRYAQLWNSLNAKRWFGWDVNPWVWVIEFKKLEGVKQ